MDTGFYHAMKAALAARCFFTALTEPLNPP
ncbi:MAG: hypothetical protein RIR70_1259, partial [Pseudomonadota bacterium]